MKASLKQTFKGGFIGTAGYILGSILFSVGSTNILGPLLSIVKI